MMAPFCLNTRKITLFAVIFVINGLCKSAMLTSAASLFRREETRILTAQDSIRFPKKAAFHETPDVNEDPPTRPMDGNSEVLRSQPTMARQNHASTILSRMKSSIRIHPQEVKIRLYGIAKQMGMAQSSKNPASQGNYRQDIMTATRLSGGAEQELSTTPERSDQTTETAGTSKSPPTGAFLGNLDNFRKRSLKLPQSIVQGSGPIMEKFKSTADIVQKTSSRVAPSVFSTLSLLYTSNKGMSVLSLYALALLGASCGFHLFLHFITIGYALGIGLPISVALYVYNKHSILPRATLFHSFITVAWSVRMLVFFLWREYISWPALHEKVVEIQKRMKIPFASRLLCWLVYSFFYLSMMSMSLGRLQQGMNAKWGFLGLIGLLMQIGGLGLETIADLQKNGFKARNRHAWCNVGVWKWSSHPNYLGEGLFWWGSYLSHGFNAIPNTVFSTIGLGFIMSVLKGSTRSLSIKHLEKYGDQPEFFEFQRTHSIWGPKQWWWWIHGMEHLSEPTVVVYTDSDGNSTSIANSSSQDDSVVAPNHQRLEESSSI